MGTLTANPTNAAACQLIIKRLDFSRAAGATNKVRKQASRFDSTRVAGADGLNQQIEWYIDRRNLTRDERESKVPAPEQRAQPRRRLVRITVRRRMLKWTLAHAQQVFDQGPMRVRVRAQRAQGTGYVMKRSFELSAPGRRELV